jgi:HEAT repeat protein
MRYVGERGKMPGVLAVAKLGAQAARPEILTALIQRLSDEVAFGRDWAAVAMGRMGPAAVRDDTVTALVRLTRDPIGHVRSSAAFALGALGEGAAKDEVLAALILLLRDPDKFVWSKAADALGWLKRPTPEVLNALIELSRSADPTKQATAIRILRDLGPVNNSRVLAALMQLRGNVLTLEWSRAVSALGALGAANTPKALVTAVRSLRDPDSTVRRAAADALYTMTRQRMRIFIRVRWFLPIRVTPRSIEELAEF